MSFKVIASRPFDSAWAAKQRGLEYKRVSLSLFITLIARNYHLFTVPDSRWP